MRKTLFLLAIISLIQQFSFAQNPDHVVVRPTEIDDVLTNPGIGFTTFQRFNGDSVNEGDGWTEGFPIEYQENDGDLTNVGYPQTTIAYYRVDWSYFEPEEGEFNWELIDKALKTAAERGQTLMFRLVPYEAKDKDVPHWYRKMVGKEKGFDVRKWRVDPENPLYVKYFGRAIAAIGQRYDGHPDLESVDISIVGFWGEGEGSHLLTDKTRIALLNVYLDSFKETILNYQPLNGDAPDPGILVKGTNINATWPDGRNNGTGPGMRHVGYRLDCMGDVTERIFKKEGWSHMKDIYPKDIIKSGMYESWKEAPVTMEICWTFLRWMNMLQYDEETVEYIFSEALKWHISSFNAKSSPVPEEWSPLVNKWLNKMGYRYVIRKMEYPKAVYQQGQLKVESLWENIGVAPIYKDYKVAVRLTNETNTTYLMSEVDITNWLPGDILFDEEFYLPHDIPAGDYQLQIAIVEPVTRSARVQLAIEGKTGDGWYDIGPIEVKERSY